MPTPPDTPREPVTDELHGVTIEDPYRWLEQSTDRVREWEQRQNEYTDAVLDTPRRDSLADDLDAVGHVETYFLPVERGGKVFQRIEPASAEQPALTVRGAGEQASRTLVDPDEMDSTTSLQWFRPDLDGDRVLYGLIDAGTEQYDLRVVATESGEVLDRIDDVGRCNPWGVAWDEDGFYYVRTGRAGDGGQLQKELCYHPVGGDDRSITTDFPRKCWPTVHRDRETGTIVVAISELAAASELYDLGDGGDLEPVITDVDAPLFPHVTNGRVLVRTSHEAPRGRLLACDAARFSECSSLSEFDTLVPGGDDVLANVAPTASGFALHRLRDAASVVSIHDPDGTCRFELDLPELAGIPRDDFRGTEDSSRVYFQLTGVDEPQAVVRASTDPEAGPTDWERLQRPELPPRLDPAQELDLTVQRRWVDSTDGASVPVYIVHRGDIEPDRDTPALLYGYGGFRNPLVPELDPYRLPFLADGGVFAQVCLRGGLEFGEEWHEAGSREHKTHTFDDFEVAADALVEWGYTSPERLAGWGRSNGGLTVGAVLTRAPDSFGAILCNVPLLDMLRYHTFLLGETWVAEYGNPDDPDEFEWLYEFSPYHNVEAVDYPATLFTTAAGDTRVHPMHARKMTARVQEATTGEAPICFRSHQETGHGVGTVTSVEIDQQLDKWAFIYESLDIERKE